MKTLQTIAATATLLAGFAVSLPAREHYQGDFTNHARELVGRTQNDLRAAADFERHKGKQIDRYENAQKHLSDFDRRISRGDFDKDKLDTAIDDVKNVVDHNTLAPQERDELRRDLADLRGLRSEYDHIRHE